MRASAWAGPVAAIIAFLSLGGTARAAPPLEIVTSFSILADLTRQIGGDRVHVTSLIGPDGDAHVYQPTPSDARSLAAAQLFIVNGLGLEGWIDRLAAAAGYRGPIITASAGIVPLRVGGTEDPHAWQDVGNVERYVRTIAAALAAADPGDAAEYGGARDRYLAQLDTLDRWIREQVSRVPEPRRRVVTSHDAFYYFGRAYGVAFYAPSGVSEDSEPTARDLAALIRQIRADHIVALFVETKSDPRLVIEIGRETGVAIGGTLRTDSLSPPGGAADSYIAFMRANVTALLGALEAGR